MWGLNAGQWSFAPNKLVMLENKTPMNGIRQCLCTGELDGGTLGGSDFSHENAVFAAHKSELCFQVSLVPMSYGWPQEFLNPSL